MWLGANFSTGKALENPKQQSKRFGPAHPIPHLGFYKRCHEIKELFFEFAV